MSQSLSSRAPDPLTDEGRLVKLAQKQDRGAFGQLYRSHYPAIVGCLYRRTGDAHTAEDLAADTFMAAFAAIPRYRVTTVPLRMWLLRIATNAANKWARERQRLRLSRIGAIPAASDAAAERQAAIEEAQAALLALEPDHQAVISLHYLESLSVEETAAVLRCAAGTVKSRLSRAREAMREHLERRRNGHG
jgi:RNA polymerase sigma-70 factor (ECF subfamily)